MNGSPWARVWLGSASPGRSWLRGPGVDLVGLLDLHDRVTAGTSDTSQGLRRSSLNPVCRWMPRRPHQVGEPDDMISTRRS